MSIPAPTSPPPTVFGVARAAAEKFLFLVLPVFALAATNHYQGQTVNISALYQAIYAAAAAAGAILYHGIPALRTKSAQTAEAKFQAAVKAAVAAQAPAQLTLVPTPPAV